MTDAPQPSVNDDRERLQAFYESAAAYQSRLFEASSGYNQVVVLAAYAGFFTIWSTVRQDVPHWLLLISGALMAISLILYVAWTIASMVVMQGNMVRLLGEYSKGVDGYLARVQAVEAQNLAAGKRLMRYWKPTLWSSGLTGMVAGLLIAAGAFQAAVAPRQAAAPSASPTSSRTGCTGSAAPLSASRPNPSPSPPHSH